MGLSMNGISQFGNIGSLYYEGMQFGYKFQNLPSRSMPVSTP